MEAFDNELDAYYDSIDKVNDCKVCGDAIYEDKEYCSRGCYVADN